MAEAQVKWRAADHTTNLQIMKEPMCLIETDDSGKVEVSETCIKELKQLNGKLVVVSIVGLYRTGKSYLMNRLAGKSSGFALGASIRSKTKGIWIWVCKHPTQAGTYLVLLDTEGLGDAKKGSINQDNWVFTLALLLSTTLIYNVLGCVNADMISKLEFSFITEISNRIMVHKDGGKNDSEFDLVFPNLVMALRDFSLTLEEDDGTEITPDEYLESLLQMDSEKGDEYNRPRSSIRKYFKNRKCFTFDRPGNRKQLQTLETISDEEINVDFLDDTKRFLDFAYKKFPILKLDKGVSIDGEGFGMMCTTYVQAIKDGKVPCVETASDQVVRLGNKKALDRCLEIYNQEMSKLSLPLVNEDDMTKHHSQARNTALKYFSDKIVTDKDRTIEKEFNEKIASAQKAVISADKNKSIEICQKVLDQYGRKIANDLNQKVYFVAGGYSNYKQDVTVLEEEYKKRAKGVAVGFVWSKYLVDHLSDVDGIRNADEQLTEAQRKVEEAEYRAEEEERHRKLLEDQYERNRKNIEEMKKEFAETQVKLQATQERQMNQMLKKQEEISDKRLKESVRLMKEGFEKRAAEERRAQDALKEQNEKLLEEIREDRESRVKEQKAQEDRTAELLAQQNKSHSELMNQMLKEQEEMREDRGAMNRRMEKLMTKNDKLQSEHEKKNRGGAGFFERIGNIFTNHL